MVLRDGMIVVVHDDDQAAREVGRVVEALERKAARKRAVPDDRDDVVGLVRQIARIGHAERQPDRGRGVTHGEQVVLRLERVREPGHLEVVRGVAKCIGAPREHLVRIGLMRDVVDDLVVRGREHAVQCAFELDGAEVGGHMAAHRRRACEYRLANLLAKGRKLAAIECLHVSRRRDMRNDHAARPSLRMHRAARPLRHRSNLSTISQIPAQCVAGVRALFERGVD